MSQIRTRSAIVAAILFVAAIGVASALDYSSALGNSGQLGIPTPAGIQLSHGPFDPRMDMGNNISLAILPGGRITNFRDIKNLSRETLASIRPVPERKPLG
jgi:hypothetical protein